MRRSKQLEHNQQERNLQKQKITISIAFGILENLWISPEYVS
jgi:hypothetical protein